MTKHFLLIVLLLTQLALIFSDLVSIENSSSSEEEDSNEESLEDKRQFKALTLDNGMKVLLISERGSSEANMALDVKAGYMNSPKNAQFLADLFAHTFLMTLWPNLKQEIRRYKYFLTNDGYVSSITMADRTLFDLRTIRTSLDDILKRLSDQLVSPKISMDLLERGIWEYNQDMNFDYKWDDWRFKTFLRSTADPNHQYYADNLITAEPNVIKNESLNKMALLKEMHKFYDLHYSANLMTLVLVSNKNMSEMVNLVVPLFSRVPNRNLPMPVWLKHPYGPDQTGFLFHMELHDNFFQNRLILLFPITDYASSPFASEPWSYATYVLTKKGQRSLQVVLKRRGLAKGLKAYVEKVAEGFGFFKISCHLTEKGQTNRLEVVGLILEYINYVKSVPPQQWIHNEIQTGLERKYKDLREFIMYSDELMSNLRNVPAQYLTDQNYVMDEFQPESIAKVLSQLRPDNMNVYVWTATVAGMPGKSGKFFDKKFTIEKMNESFSVEISPANQSSTENNNFTLPYPNRNLHYYSSYSRRMIRQNLTAISPKRVLELKLISESESNRVWYLKYDSIKSQKIVLHFKLMNSLKHDSLANYAASIVHGDLLATILQSTFEYERNVGFLTADLSSLHSGYSLWFTRKNDLIFPFVIKAFTELLSTERIKKHFAKYKNKLWSIRKRENFFPKPMMYANFMQSPLKWTEEQISDSLTDISIEQVERFHREFFSKLYIEVFSYGNIDEQKTLEAYSEVLNVIRKNFDAKPLSLNEIQKPKMSAFPEGRQYVFRTTPAKRWPKKSAARLIFQLGPFQSLSKLAISKLSGCMIQGATFRRFDDSKTPDPLKEKHNILSSLATMTYFIIFHIQRRSSSYTPEQMDSDIEEYLKNIEQKLMKINEKKYEQLKKGCIRRFLDLPSADNSIEDVVDLYRDEIESGEYSFNKTRLFDLALQNVSKADILSYYKEVLSADSPKRRKFAVYTYPASKSKDSTEKQLPEQVKNVTYITDIVAFKNSLSSYAISDESTQLISLPQEIGSLMSDEIDDD